MASKKKRVKTKFDWKEFKRQKVLMFWAAIFVIYGVIFYYLRVGGWVIAFQNYKPALGMFKSEFVGLQKFQQLFPTPPFGGHPQHAGMGVINLVLTFVAAIVFAILLKRFG